VCGKKRKKEEDDGVANGIAASGVPIQADGRGAHQSLPPVEDQRPSFRGPGHPRSGRLQMGALGFASYSLSLFFSGYSICLCASSNSVQFL
jgi:hypothetical protein